MFFGVEGIAIFKWRAGGEYALPGFTLNSMTSPNIFPASPPPQSLTPFENSPTLGAPYSKLPPHRTCVFSCAAKPRRMSLKRNLRFSGTGFFFSKDLLLFSTEKKFFRFLFNYIFFFPQRIYIFFHTKKVFSFSALKSYGLSLFTVMLRPQKVTKACSKTIAHICFSLWPFGGGGGDRFFFDGKNLYQNPGACP